MILSAVLRRALGLVAELELPVPCRRDLVAVLEAHDGRGINLWHEVGLDAGLEREELLARGVALCLMGATINLCDDIMDGDAAYVGADDAPRAQFLAHTAFVYALARTSISPAGVARATRLLFDVGGVQHSEVNRPPWDEARYRELARCSGGRQAAAYLRLLWDGTTLEAEAEATGEALGLAGFVRADLADRDPRFTALPPDARRAIVAGAAAELARVEATSAAAGCRAVAAGQRAALEADAARLAAEPPCE